MKNYTVVLTGESDLMSFLCATIEDSIIEIRSADIKDFLSIFNRTAKEKFVQLCSNPLDSMVDSVSTFPCNHISLLAYLCSNSQKSAIDAIPYLSNNDVLIGCYSDNTKCTLYCSAEGNLDAFFSILVGSSDLLDSYSIQEDLQENNIYIHFCCAKTALKFVTSIVSLSLFDRGYCQLQLLAEILVPFDGNFHKLARNQTIRKYTNWEGGLLFEGNLKDSACGFFNALDRHSPYSLGFTKSPKYDEPELKPEIDVLDL